MPNLDTASSKTTAEKNTKVKSANIFKIVVKTNSGKKNTEKVDTSSICGISCDYLHPDHSI